MSDVTEWIKERRRIREHALTPDERVDTEDAYPTLLTAVEKVLELHQRGKDGKCVECFHMYHGDWYAYRVDYPCPTARAIEGAINECLYADRIEREA